jgi:zinc/manganese transport system permease protein
MMVPAIAARFWVRDLGQLALLAGMMAMVSGWAGLLLSFHADLPSGPAIVLVAGGFYAVSLLFGRHDGLLRRREPLQAVLP